jgi:hypothetical protein
VFLVLGRRFFQRFHEIRTGFTTEITEIPEKTFRLCSVRSVGSVVDVKLAHDPVL